MFWLNKTMSEHLNKTSNITSHVKDSGVGFYLKHSVNEIISDLTSNGRVTGIQYTQLFATNKRTFFFYPQELYVDVPRAHQCMVSLFRHTHTN